MKQTDSWLDVSVKKKPLAQRNEPRPSLYNLNWKTANYIWTWSHSLCANGSLLQQEIRAGWIRVTPGLRLGQPTTIKRERPLRGLMDC